MSGVPPIVARVEDVTPEWLGAALRHSGALPGSGRVIGFEAEDVGTGQVGRNVRFRLQVEGASEDTPASVVAKLPATDALSRMTGVTQGNYQREVAFYAELVHTLGIRTPRCHFGAFDPATSDFVLVFEDLAPARQGDQIAGCTVAEAALALEELSRLHAPRWEDPALDRIDWLMRRTPESAQLTQVMYQQIFRGFADRYADRLTPDALDLAERLGPHVGAYILGVEGPRTVTHGDYRLDNMLFGTEQGGAPLAVVDWQTPAHAFALADASYFLGASLTTEDRRKHERDLLADYHAALVAGGVTGYDLDQVLVDYRHFAFAGVLMAVVASMIVGRSERGDDMFVAMASRHCAHALDWNALDVL